MDGEDDSFVEDCPACGEESIHQVVRAAASGWTVQCLSCEAVRTVPAPPKLRLRTIPVILSEGADSRTLPIELDLEGTLAVDDEYDLLGHRVRVTQLEAEDGTRPRSLPVRQTKTIYAVVFDTVTLHYTVNEGDTTRSFQEAVLPEEEVHVGSVREVQGLRLAVKTLKSDQNRTLHRGFLLARNVRRVFADVAPDHARPGQKVKTRARGAGPWGSPGASNRDRRPRGTGPRRS